MSNLLYILQALLYLLAIGSIPVALTKRKISRKVRLAVALFPIALGVMFYLFAHQKSGLFVALMGLWALFFVTIQPQSTEEEDKA